MPTDVLMCHVTIQSLGIAAMRNISASCHPKSSFLKKEDACQMVHDVKRCIY